MQYTTYFEMAGLSNIQLIFISASLFIPLCATFINLRADKLVLPGKVKRLKSFSLIFGCITGTIGLIGSYGIIRDYNELTNQYTYGNIEVVTGLVRGVTLQKKNGDKESFVVGNQKFSYSHNEASSTFNKTRKVGGPIVEGLPVRITHYDGKIIKLEIGK
ncbi:hypothetical protein [Vibrio parahaemolyticus]|uniref:hypothetical protein n=1 Tax=Vibrio parahaemolyticus TaxID=670 RepID=UPI0033065F43